HLSRLHRRRASLIAPLGQEDRSTARANEPTEGAVPRDHSSSFGGSDPPFTCTGIARLPSAGLAEALIADSHRSCQRRHPVGEQEGQSTWATHPGPLARCTGQRLRVLALRE